MHKKDIITKIREMGFYAKKSIRVATFFLIFAAILAVIVYFAVKSHSNFEKEMVSQAQAQLTLSAISEAKAIVSYLNIIERELQMLAANYAVRRALIEKIALESGDPDHISSIEDSFRHLKQSVDFIYLIDAAGVVVDMSPLENGDIGKDLSQLPNVNEALRARKLFTRGVFKTLAGSDVVASICPVFEGEKFIGIVRGLISLERLGSIIAHMNKGSDIYALLLDENGSLIYAPDKSMIGKNIFTFFQDRPQKICTGDLSYLLSKAGAGEKGAEIFEYLSRGGKKTGKKAIMAYAPVWFENEKWYLLVGMNYDVIIGPVHGNAIGTFLFAAFVILVFAVMGTIFFIVRQKEIRLETAETALKIINRQLHVEIDESRKIEKDLRDSLGTRKKTRK